MSNSEMLSLRAAAQLVGKDRTTVLRWCRAGSIPGATRDDAGTWLVPTAGLVAAGRYDPSSTGETPSESLRRIQVEQELEAVRAELEATLQGRSDAVQRTTQLKAELAGVRAERDRALEHADRLMHLIEAIHAAPARRAA